jgi:hypothetical protein
MRSRTETEMAFMEMLKVSSLRHRPPHLLSILLRKLPGKVLEKFQIFSDTTAGFMRVFDSEECRLPAGSRNERRDQYPRKEKG